MFNLEFMICAKLETSSKWIERVCLQTSRGYLLAVIKVLEVDCKICVNFVVMRGQIGVCSSYKWWGTSTRRQMLLDGRFHCFCIHMARVRFLFWVGESKMLVVFCPSNTRVYYNRAANV